MRVLLHAINGVGLGHLVRTWCLARAIRARHPEARVLFVTNARDPSLVRDDGFDLVHLPPKASEPHADPHRGHTALPDPLDALAVAAVIEAFRPDLAVFDTHAPPAAVAAATAVGARTVLVLRELRPEAFAAFLAGPEVRAFDRVLVPHDADEVDPATLPDAVPAGLVGPIARPPPDPAPDAPDVLVVAGGGGQPVEVRRMLRAAAHAHWLARARHPELRTTLVRPPGIGALPRYEGLTVRPPGPDVPAVATGARVVVGQAGYNTIAELRALRKPAVLVPGSRRAEDQAARARRLAAIGAARVARPTAESIASGLRAALGPAGARMAAAHDRAPLVPRNAEAADAALRLLSAPRGPVRKVVVVAHDFPPRVGGMETVAARLAAALAADGLEVVVYTADRVGVPDAVGGARVRPLFTPLRPPAAIDLWRDLLLTVDALLRDRPDAVHLANAGLAPWVPALRAAWPCRVTVHVHGNDLLSPWVAHGAPPDAFREAQDAGLRAADAVIPVSSFSAGLARARGVDPARLTVVPNAVDVPAAAPPAPDGPPVVLTVSRLAPRKGHATVVRALADLPGVVWRFTGRDDVRARALRALAAEVGVADRVEGLGFVPDAALPGVFAAARVFVLVPDDHPGDVEGFGVALLEAAAAGLVVVASRVGGVPEAVEDGVTGLLVPPGDPAATAAAIGALLADPARARAMGEAGRARARAFSWARAAGALRAALDAATPGPGDLGGLRALAAAPDEGAWPHVPALRERLRGVDSGAALAREARRVAYEAGQVRAERRARYAREAARGRAVHLRATGDGERLLGEALRDAAAAGVVPEVELRLSRFLDLHAALSARVGRVRLHQALPADPGLPAALDALPPEAVARIGAVHLHLRGDAADPVAVVPEVHAVRSRLAARGVTVVPPPDLARYLSLTPSEPPTAMIEPTNRCNLGCPTCPTGTGKIRPLPDLTEERFRDVVGQLRPALRNLALWNYGEPTLHRSLPALVAHAKAAGVGVVKVSSNVHFLNGERAAALLASGLDVLILSVDGASQETYATFRQHGRFDRVAAQVRHLCAEKRRLGLARPSIELQFIAMRHNEHELPTIRALAAEWGVDRLRIKTFGADDDRNRALVPSDPALSRYAADGATPNRIHPFCTRPWDHTVVNVDGSVTPCCWLRPDMGGDVVMGNVFETPFRAIWRGERYRAFRRRMLAGRAGMPVCGTCRGATHDLVAAVEEVP